MPIIICTHLFRYVRKAKTKKKRHTVFICSIDKTPESNKNKTKYQNQQNITAHKQENGKILKVLFFFSVLWNSIEWLNWKGFFFGPTDSLNFFVFFFVIFNKISNSSEFLNLTLWMPIREWINSNRSRSYVLSHSTCDTVLKKSISNHVHTTTRYRNTEKEHRKIN